MNGITGGEAYNHENGTASASTNTVTISGGTVSGDVYGGVASSDNGTATVTGNTVTISGGHITDDVYGGYAYVYNNSGSATATGNSVTISGGRFDGNIYGGYIDIIPAGTATGNTVTISGTPTFGSSTALAGGDGDLPGTDYFSGNRLNILNYTGGSSVDAVKNFQYFNFLLPASFTTSGTGLRITHELSLTDGTKSSTIEAVNFQGGGPTLQVGDVYTLLRAGSITGTITNNGQTIIGRQGAGLSYTFLLSQDNLNNVITAQVMGGGQSLNPQMKAMSEGHASGTIAANEGADLVAEEGIASAVAAVRRAANSEDGAAIGSFGVMRMGRSTYQTGSHLNANGFSLATGIAVGGETPLGHLTAGPFLEFGTNSYTTHNSFSDAASVNGDGDAQYVGGGILGRLDFAEAGPGRPYAEASVRAGSVHNRYGNDDMVNGSGQRAGYSMDAPYYGLHAGGGYVWDLPDALTLDTYAKYFWTRQQAKSVTMFTGDTVNFAAADSNRLRLGSRLTRALNDCSNAYAGVAVEREFSGKFRATSYGESITPPSLRGDTGIGELGMSFQPSQNTPLVLDLGVQGYAGKRDGVSGSIQAMYEF